MGLRSFHEVERKDVKLSTPNVMTGIRAVGGPILGVLLMSRNIDPIPATAAAGLLFVTDAEGNAIGAAQDGKLLSRWRDKLRIWPTAWGRKGDPIADKLLTIGLGIGVLVGDYMPAIDAGPMLGAELAVAGASIWADKAKNADPKVGKLGKVKLAVLGTLMTLGLVVDESQHEVVQNVLHAGTVGVVAASALTFVDLIKQGRRGPQLPIDTLPAEHPSTFEA